MSLPRLALAVIGDEIGPTLDEMISFCTEHAVRRLDMRTVEGRNLLALSLDEGSAIARRIEQTGLAVPTFVSPLLKWPAPGRGSDGGKVDFAFDPADCPADDPLVHAFDMATVFGAEKIRVFSHLRYPGYSPSDLFGPFERLADLGATYSINVEVENEPVCNIGSVGELAAFFAAMEEAMAPGPLPVQLRPLIEGQNPAPGEKVVIYLNPSHSSQIVRSVPLKWVLTPKFNDGEETVFEQISAVDLHRAAAFTTMSQLAHAGLKTHDFIRRMIEKTPRRRIKLGRDIPGVPRAIKALLADPHAAAAVDTAPAPEQPLITVIIPVYDGAAFLHEAIASVLKQNYSALEIIVVDDGSTDDIEGAVARLPIDVRFFRQANGGPACARNRGIRDASGDYIAFLDVDDLWPDGNLDSLVAAIEETNADVVIGRGQLAQMRPGSRDYDLVGNPEESYPHYIGSALYRRDVFTRNGLFDEEMRFGEDTDWYNRASENGLNVVRLDQTSLIVRRHEGNMTRGKTMVELALVRVAKKVLDRRRQLQANAAQA